jgi:hypothetical protein
MRAKATSTWQVQMLKMPEAPAQPATGGDDTTSSDIGADGGGDTTTPGDDGGGVSAFPLISEASAVDSQDQLAF